MNAQTTTSADSPTLSTTLKAKITTIIGWLTAAIIVLTQIIEVIELVKIERATSVIDQDTTVLVEKAKIQLQNQLLQLGKSPTPSQNQ